MPVPPFRAFPTGEKRCKLCINLLEGWRLFAKLHQNDSYQDGNRNVVVQSHPFEY